MKDTSKLKNMLIQTIREVPSDFALSEARFHLNLALQKIEQVESKRIKREDQQRQNLVAQLPAVHTPATLDAIDKLIAAEEQKIQEIRTKRQQASQGDETLFG